MKGRTMTATTRSDRKASDEVQATYEREIMNAAVEYAKAHHDDDFDELMYDISEAVTESAISREEAERRIAALKRDQDFADLLYGSNPFNVHSMDDDPLDVDADIRAMIEGRIESEIAAKVREMA